MGRWNFMWGGCSHSIRQFLTFPCFSVLRLLLYCTIILCECDPSCSQEKYNVDTSLIEEPCLEASQLPAWLESQHRTSQGRVSICPLVGP